MQHGLRPGIPRCRRRIETEDHPAEVWSATAAGGRRPKQGAPRANRGQLNPRVFTNTRRCGYGVSSNTVPSPNCPPKDVVPYNLPFRGTRRASERKPSGPPKECNTVSVQGFPVVVGGSRRKTTPPKSGPPRPPVDAVPKRLPPE